ERSDEGLARGVLHESALPRIVARGTRTSTRLRRNPPYAWVPRSRRDGALPGTATHCRALPSVEPLGLAGAGRRGARRPLSAVARRPRCAPARPRRADRAPGGSPLGPDLARRDDGEAPGRPRDRPATGSGGALRARRPRRGGAGPRRPPARLRDRHRGRPRDPVRAGPAPGRPPGVIALRSPGDAPARDLASGRRPARHRV